MQSKMWVPVTVLGAVVALIATLVFLGKQEQQGGDAPAANVAEKEAGKAKPGKAKGKGRPKEAALNHANPIEADRAAAPEGAPHVVVVVLNATRGALSAARGAKCRRRR